MADVDDILDKLSERLPDDCTVEYDVQEDAVVVDGLTVWWDIGSALAGRCLSSDQAVSFLLEILLRIDPARYST